MAASSVRASFGPVALGPSKAGDFLTFAPGLGQPGIFGCGLTVGGMIACTPNAATYQRTAPGMTSLVLGNRRACGLRADQTMTCWLHSTYDTWQHAPERLD